MNKILFSLIVLASCQPIPRKYVEKPNDLTYQYLGSVSGCCEVYKVTADSIEYLITNGHSEFIVKHRDLHKTR